MRPGHLAAQLVREDLHVPGEHDELDVELVDELAQARLGDGLRVPRDGHVVEGLAVERRDVLEVAVVADDADDLDRHALRALAVQEVDEAVRCLRGPSSRVRTRRPTTSSRHVMANRAATSSTAGSSSARSAAASTWTRMKNSPESGSPNCCDSVMLPPSRPRAPATACTIPGPSGHESVRTQCVGSPVGGCAVRVAGTSVTSAPRGSVVDTPQRVAAPAPGRGSVLLADTTGGRARSWCAMSDTMSP